MTLPFKTTRPAERTIAIEDGFGSSIEIPSSGYASTDEYMKAMELFVEATDADGNPLPAKTPTLERDLVILFLRSRFGEEKTPASQLLKMEDGRDIGVPLLKALFAHFVGELGMNELEMPGRIGTTNSNKGGRNGRKKL